MHSVYILSTIYTYYKQYTVDIYTHYILYTTHYILHTICYTLESKARILKSAQKCSLYSAIAVEIHQEPDL